MRLKSFRKVLVIISFICLPVLASAQFEFGDEPLEDPDPPAPDEVPFDAGLTVLIGAGIAYAAKKRHDKRKAEKIDKG